MTDPFVASLRKAHPRPPSTKFWFHIVDPLTPRGFVRVICKDHQISEEDFFDRKRRCKKIIACRTDAINQLLAAGFSKATISRAVGRHYDTVRHWADPGKREHRLARFRAIRKGRMAA
jgi:hypothetical protein